MKSKIFIFLFAFIALYIHSNRYNDWNNELLHWDQSGYHLYLPAVVTYHDLDKLNFYPEIERKYNVTPGVSWASITEMPNGNRLNKYAVGLALHELPFYLVAQMASLNIKGYDTDGYSIPFQWASIISTIFWVMMGLAFLRLYLRKYFSDNVVLVTLIGIAFATNLYYYTFFSIGMSHPYAFFQFSLLLFLTDRLANRYTRRDLCLIALTMGLIVITRPTNALAILIPTLWGVYNYKTLSNKIAVNLTRKRIIDIAIASLVGAAILMLQLGYWKYITGSWIYYSYSGEGFIWTEPKILAGLFGFRKGWFIYTPIAFWGVLTLFLFYKQKKQAFFSILLFLAFSVYVTFCWWNWWYGGSYGSRPLIESIAFLSLPMATLLAYISKKGALLKGVTTALLAIFIYLNTFQSFQLSKNIISYDSMTAAAYYHSLFKMEKPKDMDQYFLSREAYSDESHSRLMKVNPQ